MHNWGEGNGELGKGLARMFLLSSPMTWVDLLDQLQRTDGEFERFRFSHYTSLLWVSVILC